MNTLDVFVTNFVVVPGWMMLGEIIGEVAFSGDIEVILFYSVLCPSVSHVE